MAGHRHPVAVPPDTGVDVEVRAAIALVAGVVPEPYRHGRHGLADDEFADLPDNFLALGVERGDVDTKAWPGEFATADRQPWIAA